MVPRAGCWEMQIEWQNSLENITHVAIFLAFSLLLLFLEHIPAPIRSCHGINKIIASQVLVPSQRL